MKKSSGLAYHLFVFLILVVVSMIILPSIRQVKFAAQADESYYLKYATAISQKGLGEFRNLFKEYIGNEQNWIFPNPLRIGFIVISAVFCKVLGNSFASLAYLSFLSYLIFIAVNYFFCRRIFDDQKAAFLALLVAFSPVNMAMARRALSESTANLFLGLSIWLFLDLALKDNRTIKKISFALVFLLALLTKEPNMFLIVPICLFFVICKVFSVNIKLRFSDALYIIALPLFCLFIIYYLASGGIFRGIQVANLVSNAIDYNQYAIYFGSGPWYRYIIDYMLLSPWVVILSLGFIFLCLTSKQLEARVIYFLTVFICLFFVLNFLTKNIRYVMILDMPMRLFSILALKQVAEARFPKYAFALTIVFVGAITIYDYINFSQLFLTEEIYDPVSFMLLKAKQMIPWVNN